MVDEITLGCKDVNLYAVWNFEGTLPGMNVLTDDNTTFDFEDGNIGYVNFDGATQTVSDGVLSTQGNGAWYVYMNRSYYNLTGYGRPVAIAFKYKEEADNSDDFVQIIGNGVWEGTQTYSPTTEWQSAHYLADTTNGANLSDPSFIIYAVAGSGKLCFDDFVLAPAYSFTYFVDGEEYKTEYISPLDENGDYNFECLEAIDIETFNRDMGKLLSGERVELPTFNFKIGKREYHGNFKQLGPDDILVIEGIHGLNPKTSSTLPDESKYKIYISALTSMNLDGHNRIPTTDGRLLRRMVRDARTRGADAKRTIGMWPSVRRGEEEYIFPFQEQADAMFNSALIYELAVIKQFAEPLLFQTILPPF